MPHAAKYAKAAFKLIPDSRVDASKKATVGFSGLGCALFVICRLKRNNRQSRLRSASLTLIRSPGLRSTIWYQFVPTADFSSASK
jgi:hypothetical protein